jgi:hypothetical protein
MVQVFYSQKIKQLIKQLELTPEVRLLGYNFSVTLQNGDSDAAIEITEIIEKLPTIWRD